MAETFIRFIIGGLLVSAFSSQRQSPTQDFAGLLAAAPFVALAFPHDSQQRHGLRGRESALDDYWPDRIFVYACASRRITMRYKLPASIVASHPS
jgi:hypothetical protein